jgi:hypothetical protein
MIRKSLIAMAFGLAIAAGTAPAARADIDIDIKLNLGYGGFYGHNVSCKTGARIVARRFNYVSIRNCTGKNYDYDGKRNGKWYHIKVNRYSGRITSVSRWWR